MRFWRTFIAISAALLLVAGSGCDSGSKKDKGDDKESAQKKSESDKSNKDKSGGSSSLPYEATGPVAKVDGETISADQYNDLVKKKHGNARRKLPKRIAKRMKSQMLNAVVDKHLIEKKLEKSDIEIEDKEVEEKFSKFTERFPDDKALSSFLKMRNTSKEEIKGQMRKDLELQEILRERGGIEVTDEEAKKHYEENPDKFKQKEQVKARHILIKAGSKGKKGKQGKASEKELEKARKKAEKVAKKAKKDDADFAKLAKKHSDGPSAKKGGELKWFSEDGDMVDKFTKKAFSMKNGEVSDPVKTQFGFHIIKREDHKEAKKKSFEEAKPEIVKTLEKKRFGDALKSYLKEIKKDIEIKKMPENVEVNASATAQRGPPGMKGLGGLGKGKGGPKSKAKMKKMLKRKLKQRAKQKKQQKMNQGSSDQSGSSGQGGSEQGSSGN